MTGRSVLVGSPVTRPRAVNAVGLLQSTAINARVLLVPLQASGLGASPVDVGFLFATLAVAQASLAIPAGLMADRFGRRPMIFLALAAGLLGALLAAVGDIPILFVSQGLAGLSQGAAQTVLFSAVASAAPPRRLGSAFAAQVMANQTGLLLGPGLAGAALAVLDTRTTFALCALPLLAAVPIALLGIGAGPTTRGSGVPLRSALGDLAGSESVSAAALLTVLMTGTWGVQTAFLPLFAHEDVRLTASQIGFLLALQALTNVGARIPAGWLLDRIPERRRVYVAGACVGTFALGLAAVPHTNAFWQLALVVCVTTPILGTASVALPALFARSSPAGRAGVAMGLYGLCQAVGSGVGPSVFGPAMTRGFDVGFSAGAVTGTVLSLGAMVAEVWSRRMRLSAHEATPEPLSSGTRTS